MKPNRRRLERAVADFLAASGLPPGGADAELAGTPRRVAEAWLNDFIDGYGRDPKELLGRRARVPAGRGRELVVVTELRFHSMCPHHLLPWEGVAHIAYVPDGALVGFGRLAAVVDALAHRLVLQETLATQIADVLFREVPSQGSACVIEAKQDCLRLRGKRPLDAVTHAEAYEGVLRREGPLRRELWKRIEKAR